MTIAEKLKKLCELVENELGTGTGSVGVVLNISSNDTDSQITVSIGGLYTPFTFDDESVLDDLELLAHGICVTMSSQNRNSSYY